MSETVEIVVNGRTVQARRDKPLIHACLQAEEEVPHYCYHPGLSRSARAASARSRSSRARCRPA